MSKYNADSQSIGDWMGREDEAMALWNDNIAPVLTEMHHAAENNGEDTEGVAYKQDWAWDQFCSRVDIDDRNADAVAAAIAAELSAR